MFSPHLHVNESKAIGLPEVHYNNHFSNVVKKNSERFIWECIDSIKLRMLIVYQGEFYNLEFHSNNINSKVLIIALNSRLLLQLLKRMKSPYVTSRKLCKVTLHVSHLTFQRHLWGRVRNNIIWQSKDGKTSGDRIISPYDPFS